MPARFDPSAMRFSAGTGGDVSRLTCRDSRGAVNTFLTTGTRTLKAMYAAPIPVVSLGILLVALSLSACSTPTLVEVARTRNATLPGNNGGVTARYHLADVDVLNFTDEVKKKLASHSSFHMAVRYGSAGTEATLGGLAAAAKVIGWGVSTASGLGLAATYIFGMGQIFDAKGHAQAYEQAFTAIQAAEATYYFQELGMGFKKVDGRNVVDLSGARSRGDIPSELVLTPDGESLYYRVSKILKVLDDTLSSKIPDLQDLKEAHGESAGPASSAKPADAAPASSKSTSGSKQTSTPANPSPTEPSATPAAALPKPTP
jgi:hypothetical protein